MSPTELLSELQARHVQLRVVGDRLRIRPADALPPDLRAELRTRQAEVVELLRARRGPGLSEVLPGGVTESQPSLLDAEVVALSLDGFAGACLVVEVRSKALDEVVVFASDNAVLDPGERRVVYRAAELRELLALKPAELRQVHEIKKTFGGSLIPS
jgi:TubC N-terminal docking domain